jgi:hypothetical protein
MGRLFVATVVGLWCWLLLPGSVRADELWICIQKDNRLLLTDNPAGYSVCRRQGVSSAQSAMDTDFEKVSLIAQGMTEAQVLKVAGEPVQKQSMRCDPGEPRPRLVDCTRWVYYYGNLAWQADVTFVSGRVRYIHKFRPAWSSVEPEAEYQKPSAPTPGPTDSAAQPKAEPPPRGTISFEKFRLLSTGMNEGEVLGVAGEPAYSYKLTCDVSITLEVSCPKRWVYNYDEKWSAELTIIGGRVTNVTNYRRP